VKEHESFVKRTNFFCIFLLIVNSVCAASIITWKGEDLDNGMQLALPTDWFVIQSKSDPTSVKVGVVDDNRVTLKITNFENSKNRPYENEELLDYLKLYCDVSGINILDYSPIYDINDDYSEIYITGRKDEKYSRIQIFTTGGNLVISESEFFDLDTGDKYIDITGEIVAKFNSFNTDIPWRLVKK